LDADAEEDAYGLSGLCPFESANKFDDDKQYERADGGVDDCRDDAGT
jgi:hypothetical protein